MYALVASLDPPMPRVPKSKCLDFFLSRTMVKLVVSIFKLTIFWTFLV